MILSHQICSSEANRKRCLMIIFENPEVESFVF